MAGAGYKLFNTGDVLTAAQVNTYLQEQAVMRFANAAARTTALSGVLAEGMVSYLMDTNAVEVYDGSAWVGVATGDITAVTAGTGLTGGGTSGSVTVSLDIPVTEVRGGTNQTTYTTGDLLYASGSNTLAKRAIGTTGQVLTVSGGVPTWATPAGGGKVLQVVGATYSTQVTSTSTTYVDTGLTASITPSSTSSKILVLFTQTTQADGASDAEIRLRLFRGATQLGNNFTQLYTGVNAFRSAMLGSAYLDSPSSTSSLTYKTDFSNNAGGNVRVNINGSTSTMTLLEIGA